MLLEIKDKLSQSKIINSPPKQKQNYAPFISKCSRFETSKQMQSKLPALKIVEQKYEQSIHSLSRAKLQNEDHAHSQFFFRSEMERFNESKIIQTPSPGYYHLERPEKSNSSHKEKSPKKPLPVVKTIPAIPDSRNKFGYNFDDKSYSLVSKSAQQLERERFLMKQYQQSLINQKLVEKRIKEQNHSPGLKDIEKKVNKILGSTKLVLEKENKNSQNISLNDLGKPKFNHIYEYHPIRQEERPIRFKMEQGRQKTSENTSKYQFFNSSERRFKTMLTEQPSVKEKLNVREYMQILFNKSKQS